MSTSSEPRAGQVGTVDSESFDCFLSHNSRDKPAVRDLAKALCDRGISVWLDEEQLPPGIEPEPLLEAAIRSARSVAVLVGAGGLGQWELAEMRVALSFAVKGGRSVIPVLLADAPEALELPEFLAGRTWVDFRREHDPGGMSAMDKLVWGITGVRPDPVAPDLSSDRSGQHDDSGSAMSSQKGFEAESFSPSAEREPREGSVTSSGIYAERLSRPGPAQCLPGAAR